MDSTIDRPVAGVRAWGQVAAAIELVAGGRYPRVAITGIPDAPRVADAFRPDAERCGVELVLEERPSGEPRSLVVQRR
jgi:hypothetical protein